MSFMDYFIGVKQSRYTAIALISAIIAICSVVLFISNDIPFGVRIGLVFVVLLSMIIPVFLSLFNLTCLVRGDNNKQYSPCGIWAWITAIIIIVNCFILIISAILSVITYKKAESNLIIRENFKVEKKKEEKDAENKIAESMIKENKVDINDNKDNNNISDKKVEIKERLELEENKKKIKGEEQKIEGFNNYNESLNKLKKKINRLEGFDNNTYSPI